MPSFTYSNNGDALVIPLSKDHPLTLGRDGANSICFPGRNRISRRHCEVFFSKEVARYILRDLGSKNGSMINQRELKNDIAFLANGDVVTLGGIRLTFNDREMLDNTETTRLDALDDTAAPDAAIATATPPAAATAPSTTTSSPTPPPPPKPSSSSVPEPAIPNQTTRPPGRPELAKGSIIGNYEVIRELGKGPNSCVYLANQSTLNRMVAIKILTQYSQNADDDFLNAIQGAGTLNHPNIVPYFDAGALQDFIYLTMPFIPDGNLETRVSSKPLPEPEVLKQFTAIADALAYAYQDFHITHQNIKTSNLLFDEEHGCLLLSDIGLADWTAKHCGVGTNWLPGSAQFTAPERTLGDSVDWRSDQYSLGIVLFTMLTGSPPFQAEDERQTALLHIKKPLPQLDGVNKNISVAKETQDLLVRLTQKDPEERFDSWQEVITAANAALAAVESPKSKGKTAPGGSKTSALSNLGLPPLKKPLIPRPPAPRPFGTLKPLPFKRKM